MLSLHLFPYLPRNEVTVPGLPLVTETLSRKLDQKRVWYPDQLSSGGGGKDVPLTRGSFSLLVTVTGNWWRSAACGRRLAFPPKNAPIWKDGGL